MKSSLVHRMLPEMQKMKPVKGDEDIFIFFLVKGLK